MKLKFLTLLVAGLLAGGSLHAQSAAGEQLDVIQVQRFLQDHPEYQAAFTEAKPGVVVCSDEAALKALHNYTMSVDAQDPSMVQPAGEVVPEPVKMAPDAAVVVPEQRKKAIAKQNASQAKPSRDAVDERELIKNQKQQQIVVPD